MSPVLLHFLFFCSGLGGLIYQVVWVRVFGNVFGSTIHTTSLVVAIFMLGLGGGSMLAGRWADRRYQQAPESLLRVYGLVEFAIAALGVAIAFILPNLHALAAASSSYVKGPSGWMELSASSYVAQGVIALILLGPSALLMGGTLTLLIRHRVRADVEQAGGWKIAALYAVNTLGAASGAFLTDFALVPAVGLLGAQLFAVVLNVVAGSGALIFARPAGAAPRPPKSKPARTSKKSEKPEEVAAIGGDRLLVLTSAALVLSGCAAMGMEIVWLRHFTVLLGGFRAVFSLVLTVILIGAGIGALAGGAAIRRGVRPVPALMLAQALLVAGVCAGLSFNSSGSLSVEREAIEATLLGLSPFGRRLAEFWYNARPILLEAGLPAVLMGASFPLGNAIIQHAERAVGGRAGVLYLSNTIGAVCGSLLTGYLLLPFAGMQGSVSILMAAAALAILPLALSRRDGGWPATVVPAIVATLALAMWLRLPADDLLSRALPGLVGSERLVAVHEGVNEVVAVTEIPGRGRSLMTNGHAMSSTALLDQRYMRALAHIPLLSMEKPSRVLVIGFGVGNTTDAVTRHPSIERVEVVDLSREVLRHGEYFRDANHDVLKDPRVQVFVNDGRQHLQMQPEGTYDLITLEPPPIAHAGVGALYSREFYELARTRLKPGGYLSQWLPAYQVPAATSLAMTRAFVDVFPQSVLLSGTQAELLLVGTRGDRIVVEPDRLSRALAAAPQAADDLRRIDLGAVTEIVGTFVGSAETLARATRQSPPVSDDRPLQEYGVRSALGAGVNGVPEALIDLSAANAWCPRCFLGEEAAPAAEGLDAYLGLLDLAYRTTPTSGRLASARGGDQSRILGSAYLGAILPDTGAVHNIIGVTFLRRRQYGEAAAAFTEALKRQPDSADAHRNLGTALAATGQVAGALDHLRRAVQLAPELGGAQYELGNLLLQQRQFNEAAAAFRAAVRTLPDFAPAHNNLGIALASLGQMEQAADEFERAVTLDPEFAESRRNLESARRHR